MVKSILILKMDALGDFILHTPMLRLLRAAYPAAKITWVCHQPVLPLAETNPYIDAVITPPAELAYDPRANFMFGLELQNAAHAPFDLIIVPRWSEDWHSAGALAHVVGAPYRISYAAACVPFKEQHFPGHDDLFTHVIDDPLPSHEVWRGLQFCDALGIAMPPIEKLKLEIHLTPEDQAKIDGLNLEKLAGPLIALAPGGSAEFKRWPAAQFTALAQKLAAETAASIILIGQGTYDAEAAAMIESAAPDRMLNYVGQFSPRETAALLARCDLLISNDSFPIHASAAMGTPVVEIIGAPADSHPASEYRPARFGPWGVPLCYLQPISCAPSANIIPDGRGEPMCIADVRADDVFKETINFLETLKLSGDKNA